MDLKYAEVNVDGVIKLNHKKVNQDDAFKIVKDNSLSIINDGKLANAEEYYLPINFECIKNILKLKNVFVTSTDVFNCFEDDKYISESPITAFKSKEVGGIIKEVNKFLERGLEVYLHSYYVMTMDRYIDDDLTLHEPWYWFKFGIKKAKSI